MVKNGSLVEIKIKRREIGDGKIFNFISRAPEKFFHFKIQLQVHHSGVFLTFIES